jgi:hypothetical protein
VFDHVPPEARPWFEKVLELLGARFCDEIDNPTAMMDAFERHNQAVRDTIPASRLLEWTASDGWSPLCERLGVPVPKDPFPVTNTTADFLANLEAPPGSA